MERINGTLRIIDDLNDLGYLTSDIIYYSSKGIDLNCREIVASLRNVINTLDQVEANLVTNSYIDLEFTTNTAVKGRYEAILYPAIYGELKHIYCLGPMGNVDLLTLWDKDTIVINKRDYYIYAQKKRVKDTSLTYRFMVTE